MKSAYQSSYYADSCNRYSQPVNVRSEINWRSFDINSLIESQLGNMVSGSRIRPRSIGNLDRTGSLMKSTKLTRVYATVITTARAYSAPASDFSIISNKRESEFCFNLFNIAPIDDSCGEGISYAQTRIGKEQIWSMDNSINSMDKNECDQNRCNCSRKAEIDALEGCINHSGGEKVSSETVSERTTTPKNFRVTTSSFKRFEGSNVHE